MASSEQYIRDGVRSCVGGRTEEGIRLFREGIQRDPANSDLWFNLGKALSDSGRTDEALDAFRTLCALAPPDIEVKLHMGSLLARAGKYAEIVEMFRDHGNVPSALSLLGWAFWQLGAADKARETYGILHGITPGHPDVAFSLALAECACGNRNAARQLYREILRRSPDNVPALVNLGVLLDETWELAEAEHVFREVLHLEPENVLAANGLGNILRKQGRCEEAITSYRQGLEVDPASCELLNNLALAYHESGHPEIAVPVFTEVLDREPGRTGTRINRAFAHLTVGNFTEGWEDLEARLAEDRYIPARCRGLDRLDPDEEIAGKRILVVAEQGLGDTLQLLRYLPLLHEEGATVLLEGPAALRPLCQDLPVPVIWVDRTAEMPACHRFVPMMSLPRLFGTTLKSIPGNTPYLVYHPETITPWEDRLTASGNDLLVGLAWSGNPANPNNVVRSVPPGELVHLVSLPGVRFISLQKDDPEGADLLREAGAFLDWTAEQTDLHVTAGLMSRLDGIVAVDTSIAHLSGALGIPTWVLLSFAPDWRWGLEGETTPWYPTMRLVRQTQPWHWEDAVRRVGAELSSLRQTRRRGRSWEAPGR
jgi:Flp pilus assembly protein TadD